MIVMATMRRLAPQHGLMFLIHEKPFAGINGSGKHNNWSMATDDGREPPRPGQRPARQRPVPGVPARRHPRRQRPRRHPARVASPTPARTTASGANEAPPAIMSIFLGSQLEDVIQPARARAPRRSRRRAAPSTSGVTSLPEPAARTRRTATGPRRSPSRATSSSSARSARRRPIYWPQTVLNTAVADSLSELADELDKLKPGDFDGPDRDPVGHRRATTSRSSSRATATPTEWHAEAARRGLPNNRTTVDALPALDDGQGQDALLEVRRAVGARARGPRRHQLGALRQGRRTSRRARALDIAKTMILPAAVAATSARLSRRRVVVARRRDALRGRSSGWPTRSWTRSTTSSTRSTRPTRQAIGRGRGAGLRRRRSSRPRTRCARSPTSWRRSSPTTCGRCRSTGSCSSSTESSRGAGSPASFLRRTNGRATGARPSLFRRSRPSGQAPPRSSHRDLLTGWARRPPDTLPIRALRRHSAARRLDGPSSVVLLTR